MFPKAKRFDDRLPTTDVPGPGTYNVPTAAPLKTGAMLEKAERFREGEEGPDVFGLYNTATGAGMKENKRPRSSSMAVGGGLPVEKVRMQMDDLKHRLQTTHEKELARVQVKLTRAEQAQAAAKAETTQLKTDLRSSQQSLGTLTAQLAKSDASLKKHQALLPTLQTKLEELTSSHSASHARKDASIAELSAVRAKLEREVREAQEALATRDGELERTGEELESVRKGKEELETENERVEEALEGARRELVLAAKAVAGDKAARMQERQRAEEETQALALRVLHLERQTGDRAAVIAALGTYSAQIEEELSLLQVALSEAETEAEWRTTEWAWERTVGDGGQKEWRQRTRSDKRELDSTRADVEFEQTVRRVEAAFAQVVRNGLEDEVRDGAKQAEELRAELEVAEGELEIALDDEIPKLEAERDDALDKVEELEVDVEEGVQELVRLRVAEREVRNTVERLRGELEEARRTVKEGEKVMERERTEKKSFVKLLGQNRAAEAGLREELEAVSTAYADLQDVRSQYTQLSRTIDQLARRNALAEADVKQLGDLNTDLISHGNPNQKIRHMASIRADLEQSRRNHLSTTSALATTQRENAALKEELDAYRAVSSVSLPVGAAASRSRVIRTSVLEDDFLAVSAVRNAGPQVTLGLRDVEEEDLSPEEDDDVYEDDEMDATDFAPQASIAAVGRPNGFGTGASVGGGRKAGRVVVTDFDREQERVRERPALAPRGSGGIRMQGKMSVSELIG